MTPPTSSSVAWMTLGFAAFLCLSAVAPTSSVASESLAFQVQLPIATGSNPSSIAVGDFNRDGKLDLATAQYGGVSVALGDGDGAFQPPIVYAVPGYVESVAVGDFNRDGKPDLVVSSWIGGASGPISSVSVLLGIGNGTFQSPIVFSIQLPPSVSTIGAQAGSLVIGDFNGDGVQDLAVVLVVPTVLVPNTYVLSLVGNGDGSFTAPTTYAAGPGTSSMAMGDFNRDGALDLAVTNFGCGDVHCAAMSISALLGNGDSSFQTATSYETTASPSALAVGDVNGDGIDDIVATTVLFRFPMPSSYSIDLLLGVGDGTFQPALSYPLTFFPKSVAIADFDRDGKPDLAITCIPDGTITINGSAGVAIMRGNRDGTFQPPVSIPTGQGQYPISITVADLNHDDKPDIVFADLADGKAIVLLNLSGDRIFSDGFDGQ